ncbi:MAG: response regulator [Desulfovibrionaceae bacterium]|nr:response regulator [Desulfovibrionaceae bacterium]MBF0512461.1 response regulator [Desulfovibrionaceae bacterium]
MKKVLIVEDSRVQAKIMSDHIRTVTPFETVIAHSLAETVMAMDREGEDIFLAVLDLNLPDDPDSQITEIASAKGVPSVVMTASFDEKVREKLIAHNVVDYFFKSVAELANLENLVERLYKNLQVKVLVADDSRVARAHIVKLLANQNYQTVEAVDGMDALVKLQENPDVKILITDYNMPKLDGYDLITEVRKNHRRDKLAIIGVSGQGGHSVAKFLKHGANDFLTKPFEVEEFYCRVNQQADILDIVEGCRGNAASKQS